MAYLARHFGEGDRGQQAEADRHIGGARAYERLGSEGLRAPALALPRAAVHEYDEFLAPGAVDIELLDLRLAIAVRFGLADPLAHGVARSAVALDDGIGVRDECALLVLSVEPGLVVIAENLGQSAASLAACRQTASAVPWTRCRASPGIR